MTVVTTLNLKISKKDFLEKLKSLTIPISIEKINRISKKDNHKWFKNLIKQDYNALNKTYKLEQNIFAETEIPDKYIFAGEVTNASAKIFIPNPQEDKTINDNYLKKMGGEELAKLLSDQSKIQKESQEYSWDNAHGLTEDGKRLFYYEIQTTEIEPGVRLQVLKHKFQHEDDGKDQLESVIYQKAPRGDITVIFYTILVLTLFYFTEKFFTGAHTWFDLISLPALILGFIGTMLSRISNTVKYIEEQRNIADEIIVLALNKI